MYALLENLDSNHDNCGASSERFMGFQVQKIIGMLHSLGTSKTVFV